MFLIDHLDDSTWNVVEMNSVCYLMHVILPLFTLTLQLIVEQGTWKLANKNCL